MYSTISKHALLLVLAAVGIEQVLSLPAVTDASITSSVTASNVASTTSTIPLLASTSAPIGTGVPQEHDPGSDTSSDADDGPSDFSDASDSTGDNSAGSSSDPLEDTIAEPTDDDAPVDGSDSPTGVDDTNYPEDDDSAPTIVADADTEASTSASSPEFTSDIQILEVRGRPRGGRGSSTKGSPQPKATHQSSTHSGSSTVSKTSDQSEASGTATFRSSASVTSKSSVHASPSSTASATKATSSSKSSTSSSAAAGCTPGKIRGRNDKQRECSKSTKDKPLEVPFPAYETDTPGLQELFDADCYAHICQSQPVLMSYWNNQRDARSTRENGNGVDARIFKKDRRDKFHTKTPPAIDGQEVDSPEEWCPASTAQGGRTATLMPVTVKAQERQSVLINNKFYRKNKLIRHDWDKKANKWVNSDEGSWFRLTKFDGAKGPYCKKLNALLAQYSTNFDKNGVIKVAKPDICTNAIANKDMGGLHYDVGQYAYQRDPHANDEFNFVGKTVSK